MQLPRILQDMKRDSMLPDFQKLCEPAQNSIMYYVGLSIFYFFLAAVGGYLWEVSIFLMQEQRFYNRGFLYGPWLPIYGVGAVLLTVSLRFTGLCRGKKSFPKAFLLSLLLCTSVELLAGWVLDVFWHLRYWDYSDYLCNFNGYICLASAVGFGLAGMFWLCALAPFFERVYKKMPAPLQCIFNTLLVLAFLFDCAASLIYPNMGAGITF